MRALATTTLDLRFARDPFLRINSIQIHGEEIVDTGPEMQKLRELAVDVLRIALRHEGTEEAIVHFDQARNSQVAPPPIAAPARRPAIRSSAQLSGIAG